MPPELQSVVDDHYQNLYRFALSLTRSPDDAWDLTQEAFLKLARKRSSIRSTSAVKSWLYTTLYREFLRIAKRGSRFDQLENDDLVEAPQESHQMDQIQAAEADDVMQALVQLKTGYRQVVSLYYLESYSYKEIASILDIPIGTVMSRLARGKEILKRHICKPANPATLIEFSQKTKRATNG